MMIMPVKHFSDFFFLKWSLRNTLKKKVSSKLSIYREQTKLNDNNMSKYNVKALMHYNKYRLCYIWWYI